MAAKQHQYTVRTIADGDKVETTHTPFVAANFSHDGPWLVFVDLDNDPVLTIAATHVVSITRGDAVDEPVTGEVVAA
jgi:hypothetical protein